MKITKHFWLLALANILIHCIFGMLLGFDIRVWGLKGHFAFAAIVIATDLFILDFMNRKSKKQ